MPDRETLSEVGSFELSVASEAKAQHRAEAARPPTNRTIPSRERRWIPPTPRGPERRERDYGQSRALRAELAAAPAAAPLAATQQVSIRKNTRLGAADNNAASNVGEPSVASNGDVVFYTGNWYAALSTDGGSTFQFIDPFNTFPDPPQMAFCCDQIVHYAPSIDMFFWSLQYSNRADQNGANIQRLAFAQTADVRQGNWRAMDITPAALGRPGTLLDFPDLALGANSLYLTTNVFTNGRWTDSAIVRMPLSGFTSGHTSASRALSSQNFAFRVANYAGDTAFWASHQDTSTLRIFQWQEGAPTPSFTDVPVAPWQLGPYQSATPGGVNWLSRLDDRIVGGAMAGNELWFGWSANAGEANNRPNPYAQIARIDVSTLQVIENIDVFDADFAIAYPALGSNVDNEVGIAYAFGGGTRHPSHAVGFVTGGVQHVTTASGDHTPADGQWGDYFTVRRHQPEGMLLAATGYTVKGAARQDGDPHFVLFGR
jgi:hypothetical protein